VDKLEATGSLRIASAVLGGALLMLVITGYAGAQVLLQVPGDSPGPPFYARTDLVSGVFRFHTDEWAAVVCYRAPDCVPSEFNLLTFPCSLTGINAEPAPGHPLAACGINRTSAFWWWQWPGKLESRGLDARCRRPKNGGKDDRPSRSIPQEFRYLAIMPTRAGLPPEFERSDLARPDCRQKRDTGH